MTTLARSSSLLFAVLAVSPAMAQWSQATLTQWPTQPAATTIGTKAMFAGGGLGIIDIYDDASGVWSTDILPTAVGAYLAATVGSKALFSNGVQVDIYDSRSGSWSSALLPHAGATCVTAVGTTAMFAGPSTVDVDVYDVSTGSWSTTALSVARIELTATTVGSKAIFAGGVDLGGAYSDVVDMYDEATGTWSTATLSQARSVSAATSVASKALFAGGVSVTGFSDRLDIYDDTTGSWSSANLTASRCCFSATSVGSKAIFAGGGWLFSSLDLVEVYDLTTGTIEITTLSLGRSYLGATTVGTKAIFAGGFWCDWNGCSCCVSSNVVDIYDDAVGAIYCSSATPNSTSLPASIAAQGFPGSVAQGYALLSASDLPPQSFGYFLNSMSQGFTANPGGSQGDLCLGGAVGRYAATPFNSGAEGAATLQVDLTGTPTPTGMVSISAGQTWNFQAWYRDANPGPTSNFTDAVSVTFL